MADIIERELIKIHPLKITGNVTNKDRQKIVDLFNNDNSRCILIMTEAGAHGLNLQVANVIINYDMPWSIAKYEQRIGRAHRIGQKDTVLVYNLLAKNTVDYYVKKVLYQKAELAERILGDPKITGEDIMQMLI